MTPQSPASSPSALAALHRDLALVAPSLIADEGRTGSPPWAISPNDLQSVTDTIRQCRAPAIVGLNWLSIEACRHAIAAAEAMRGRLLPWPPPGDRTRDQASVIQSATLGHIFASQLMVWVGCNGGDGPIAEAIAGHQLLAMFVPGDLATVLRTRQTMAADPTAEPIGKHQRVGVVLAPGLDPRVASQWHKLAAQVQTTTRMAVFALPDPVTAGNRRGALEVITWQTGQSCLSGGVDFADGGPRPCPDAQALIDHGAIDLLIDTTLLGPPPTVALTGQVKNRIVLGPAASQPGLGPAAENISHIAMPGLTMNTAARVIRCDGVVLWTCVNPAQARPDAAAEFFAALTHALRRPQ